MPYLLDESARSGSRIGQSDRHAVFAYPVREHPVAEKYLPHLGFDTAVLLELDDDEIAQ